ncbi:MAG: 4-(cytidine 5'-diphospho)-2-C-methyl-D-erythritol kinase [Lachnospiraceae bacterium]|nr:4-(cytidine 5'-diphospho)-2-C-methyl-D-erythritol kinase [Candidatus Merdinaster equi]
MKQITREAYAKINLGLDVTGKRDNGYHDVKMIMQSISLHDTLTFTEKAEGGVSISMEGGNELVPLDDHNLIYKAIKKLCEYAEFSIPSVDIHLVKRIPVAAGLAGGSTDAAATIIAVNEMFELGLSAEQLCEVGVKVGADVPFCIMGGTYLSEGIGEVLTPIASNAQLKLLLVKPNAAVSTPQVYADLDEIDNLPHPDIDSLREGVEAGDIAKITRFMGNVLELATIPEHPEIDALKHILMARGALAAMMSGSGPTVFAIFDNDEKRKEAKDALSKLSGIEGVFECECVSGN